MVAHEIPASFVYIKHGHIIFKKSSAFQHHQRGVYGKPSAGLSTRNKTVGLEHSLHQRVSSAYRFCMAWNMGVSTSRNTL